MELTEIKEIRKKNNITQNKLAKTSGVSQSLIAKIEAGKLDPTYSNAKKIFKALDSLQDKGEVKASEIMQKKVISISTLTPISEIIKKMRKYHFSYLPVIEKNKLLGLVSEEDVLEATIKGKKESLAKDIMQEPPIIISKNSPLQPTILRTYPILLVKEKEKFIGVITKTDLLQKAYEKKGWLF